MKALIDQQKQYFNSNATKPLSFRIEQLKKLKSVLKSYEQELTDAVFKDFQKGKFNTFLGELAGLYNDLNNAIKKLRKWAKIKRVGTNMVNFPARSYIMPEPLGVALVIGAWNYPINLTLVPAVAAIAAGNTVVLKPSELTVHTSTVLSNMIRSNFDPSFFAVVEGGIEETTELLAQPFDKIFFTGSISVGRIVYRAAAKNLIPVTLELGGKSPLIVEPDANLKICVKRLVWGKFVNAGQTCIAPDYVLVHKSIEKEFLETLKKEIELGQYSLENQNYAQIISEKHLDRLVNLIEPEKVFVGGEYDRSKRLLAPTVLINTSGDDKVMEDEIFGPILPVLNYEDIDSAIAFVKSRPKPLALYLFSESSSISKKIFNELSFGGGSVNEVLMHFINDELPFGGVGSSGMGSYHGEAGFKTFSHYKSIIRKPTLFELPLKYFPYKNWKFSMIKRVMGL
ncbi:MAG TPA: aldehyde dehydrogenase family protein [Chitinophagaceae bacterium]|nr:aldehyde dehydrogenase family protein [Chitinophagaceae bacterium]